MITLKQLEAVRWIVELGTFERAANRLNTTQSAISKRIQELETTVGLAVFDRAQRGARLTEKGEHLLAIGQEMLSLQERLLSLKSDGTMPARRLRLGVTELSTLTWLPRLIASLREQYPMLVIEPEVETGRDLYVRLQDDELDLIIIPEAFATPEITAIHLSDVSNAWFARPGLVKTRRALSLEELSSFPLLTQGRRSGTGLLINRWLKERGVSFQRVLACDHLTAVLGLTVAGLGIGYLPKQCFRSFVDDGKLVTIPTKPALPVIPYAAMFKSDRPSMLISNVVETAREVCDFSTKLRL